MLKKLIFVIIIIFLGWKLAENIFGNTPSNIRNINDIKMLEYEKTTGGVSVPDIYEIPYQQNLRQTPKNNVPYTIMALVKILNGQAITESALLTQLQYWRIPHDGFAPFVLRNQLQYYGINPEEVNLRFITNEQKLLYLQSELAQGSPIILLVKRHEQQHYITLLGYNFLNKKKKVFYIYDSLLKGTEKNPQKTVDRNGTFPGNETIESKELMALWEDGGVFGLYQWYGIVNRKQES